MKNKNYDMKQVANELKIMLRNFKIGPNMLFDHLRFLKILQNNPKNEPYPHYFKLGLFKSVTCYRNNREFQKTLVTEKGVRL